jgi:hypothetical protein
MATKTPSPTPNEPKRASASRAKPKAKAAAADSTAKPAPKAASKAAPASKSVKTAAGARLKAKPVKAKAADASKAPKAKAAKPAKPKAAPVRKASAAKKATARTLARADSAPFPEASAHENHVVKTLFDSLEAHVAANGLGHVVGPKQFDLGQSEPTGRLPDIAFVSFDRWAQYRRVPGHDRWHVAPDLLVQVVRKGEPAEDFTAQLDECFQAGVRRVWLLVPHKQEARVYESATDVRTLKPNQAIDGGDVLPGYEHPLAPLFHEPKDAS